MKTATVSMDSLIVNHCLNGARSRQIDIDKLLSKSGIASDTLAITNNRIPLDKAVQLTQNCQLEMQDELIGLLQYPVPVGHFRLAALCAVHSRSLGEALQRYLDFQNLYKNCFEYSLATKGKYAFVRMERVPNHRPNDNYVVDFILTVTHRFLVWLSDERILPEQIQLDFDKPDYHKEYRYLYFGAPVSFNHPVIEFQFDARYLSHPIKKNDNDVENYVKRFPLDIFLSVDGWGQKSQKIRNRILQCLDQGDEPPSLETAAQEMKCSPQTLRRALSAEHTTFKTIKEQVRRDIAIHHLGNQELSIEDIAKKTGYTEPSAFIRAFKAWTGMTPLQFKKGFSL